MYEGMKVSHRLRRLTTTVAAALLAVALLGTAAPSPRPNGPSPTPTRPTFNPSPSPSQAPSIIGSFNQGEISTFISIEIAEDGTIDASVEATYHLSTTVHCDADTFKKNFTSDVNISTGEKNTTHTSGKKTHRTDTQTCTATIEGMTPEQFENEFHGGRVEHNDGTITYNYPIPKYIHNLDISVTFPGKATQASGNGTLSARTATWEHVETENVALKARGAESAAAPTGIGASSSLQTITLGALAVLAVAGATFSYMLVMGRKKDAPSTDTAPATMYEPPERIQPHQSEAQPTDDAQPDSPSERTTRD